MRPGLPPGPRDHPRSRGVYCAPLRCISVRTGSSPLARGLQIRRMAMGDNGRIIPARAGFTAASAGTGRGDRDHPRSRGVYSTSITRMGDSGGSSPLARGLLCAAVAHSCTRGIIPARAGFTRLRAGLVGDYWDHPRSRGVYLGVGAAPAVAFGSSPLARGLRGGHTRWGLPRGIIPARAGFTPCWRRPRCRRGDHPRSRGVYRDRDWVSIHGTGSSPLARGLHNA